MLAIDATIDALLPDWPVLPPDRRAAVSAHCAYFVRRQINLSPAHIRLGIRAVSIAFIVFAFLHLNMRPFGAVPRKQRAAALAAFAHERLPPFVAFERVLRSMTLIAFLEHADVLAAIGDVVPSATVPAALGAAIS
jgi:hypothetical protein